MFSNRLIRPELMDHLPPEDARRNLADLVRINQNFGGHSVIREALARVVDTNVHFRLLDIGAASGDTARLIRRLYSRASVTSLDCNFTNLAAAPQPKLIADAFALPFGEDSFDYVFCSLFLHHFTDEKVTLLLRTFHGIARQAVVVCDLERHILPYCFLPATKLLFQWGDVAVHDGKISVRAAFRAEELRQLSRLAGIENAEVRVHRPAFRLSLIARKSQMRTGAYSTALPA